MSSKELIKGFKRKELDEIIEQVKAVNRGVYEDLRPVFRYIDALEKEIHRLDSEIYDLRQTKLFEEVV